MRIFFFLLIFLLFLSSKSIANNKDKSDLIFEETNTENESAFDIEIEIKKKIDNDLKPKCFRILVIKFEGGNTLPESEINQIRSDLFFRCFDFKIFEEKLIQIGRWYALNGYPTSRAFFSKKSDLVSGVLIIGLVEGKIGKITLNDEVTWRDKLGVMTAFPFLEGTILEMANIEQGLEQMNRLYSRKAEMKILPGEKHGESLINVVSKDGNRFKTSISTSDSGSEVYGLYPITITQDMENLLGLNELIKISRNSNEKSLNNPEHSYSNSATINIPFGYWDTTLSYSQSEYSRKIDTIYANYVSKGYTTAEIIYLNYLISRFKGSKLSLNLSLAHNKTESYVDDILVDVSSREYTNGSIGLTFSYYLPTLSININPAWKTGLNWFGHDPDPEDIREYEPHANFSLWSLNAFIGGKFARDSIFGYSSSIYSQYAELTLYGSDQIGIGGSSTIRGFKKNSISGDSGYYWRNDLTLSIPDKLKFFLPKNLSATVGIHYDRGCIRENYTEAVYCMSGAASSLNIAWEGLYLSYTYGEPVTGKKLFISPENKASYFSAGYSFYWDFWDVWDNWDF